jgi:hypothetical protein
MGVQAEANIRSASKLHGPAIWLARTCAKRRAFQRSKLNSCIDGYCGYQSVNDVHNMYSTFPTTYNACGIYNYNYLVEYPSAMVVSVGDSIVTVHVSAKTEASNTIGAPTILKFSFTSEVTKVENERPAAQESAGTSLPQQTDTGETERPEADSSAGLKWQTSTDPLAGVCARLDSIEKTAEKFNYTYGGMKESIEDKLKALTSLDENTKAMCDRALDALEAAQKRRATHEKLYERILDALDEFIPEL